MGSIKSPLAGAGPRTPATINISTAVKEGGSLNKLVLRFVAESATREDVELAGGIGRSSGLIVEN